MERLTVRDDEGRGALVCREDCKGGPACFECEQKAVDRLAAYEDTGLEPEEVERVLDAYGRGMTLRSEVRERLDASAGITTDHLRELVKNELDRRLVMLPTVKARWLKEILAERDRQDKLWGSPQENTYSEWAGILGEEYGELCKELNELNFGRGHQDRMAMEAVQVAAVALAILEQADVAHRVTVQVAAALGRLKGEGAR